MVIFTGACGLIGSACVEALCSEGARVVAVDINEEGLEKLRQRIPEGRLIARHDVDLGSQAQVSSFVGQLHEDLGRVDAVVFASYPRTPDWGKKLEQVPQASLEKNVLDHFNHSFLLSQSVAPFMARRGKGALVFFGSIYGLVGPDFSLYEGLEMTMPVAYSFIKGGVSSFVRYLACYFGPQGIRVNALCPGGVFDYQNPTFVQRYVERTPLGRMASPSDLVGPLTFLLSDEAAYVTGVGLAVDGGWTAK